MAAKKTVVPLKLGDRVKIRISELRGRIVELRGPLGPGGTHIYRVRFRGKRMPAYIEVREDQLVLLPRANYGGLRTRAEPRRSTCGTAPPQRVAEAKKGGVRLSTVHSDTYYPVPEPTIKTGVLTMSLAVLELLGK